jgi:predicted transcriptional regulator
VETWTFLTNHAHVLLCIAADPGIRLRDVAVKVGITERATQRIVADLIEGGYLASYKEGRRNRYEVNPDQPFRHPIERAHDIRTLLTLAAEPVSQPAAKTKPGRLIGDRVPEGRPRLVRRN